MKYISDFNSYKAQEINEGLKENILAGLLSLLGHYVSGQDVEDSQRQLREKYK
jgi:hypothetical protein